MREHYGETQVQSVSDQQVDRNDRRVRLDLIHKHANIRATPSSDGRCSTRSPAILCAAADILAEQVADGIAASRQAIACAARFPGPSICMVHLSKIVRVL